MKDLNPALLALKNAIYDKLKEYAPKINDQACSTNVGTGVIIVCFTLHDYNAAVTKYVTPAVVGELETAANAISTDEIIITNSVASARCYILTACIGGSPTAIKSVDATTDFDEAATRFNEGCAAIERLKPDEPDFVDKIVRSYPDIESLNDDRELLVTLADHDYTRLVWRKKEMTENKKRKQRYDKILAKFRDAVRKELKKCLEKMLMTCLHHSQHIEDVNFFFLSAINVSEDKTLSEVVRTASSMNPNLAVMIFAFDVLQKKLTVRCSVPKKIIHTAVSWLTAVAHVLGGDVRALEPSDEHTNARLASGRTEDIQMGWIYAKQFALKADMVDLTQPLAEEYPSYILGNIQYLDATKDQPPPFWFHFVRFDIDLDDNDVDSDETLLPSAAAVFESEPTAEPSRVGTRSRTPAVEEGVLPERKRAKPSEPIKCEGTSAFQCPNFPKSYRGRKCRACKELWKRLYREFHRDPDHVPTEVEWLVSRDHGKEEILKCHHKCSGNGCY